MLQSHHLSEEDRTAIRRHEALRARNRSAQKRYRVRKQQESHSVRGQVEALSLDLAVAQAQAEDLFQKNQELQTQLASGSTALTSINVAEGLRIGGISDPEGWNPSNHKSHEELELTARLLSTARGTLGSVSTDQLAVCTFECACSFFQDVVNCFATHLAAGTTGSDSLQAVANLQEEHGRLSLAQSPLSIMMWRMQHTTFIEQTVGRPQHDLWTSLAASLNLTPGQKSQLQARKQDLFASIRPIMQQRQACSNSLQEDLRCHSDVQNSARRSLLAACAESQQLRHCCDREIQITGGFGLDVMTQVLSIEQQAKLLVGTQPYKCELLAVINAALGPLEPTSSMDDLDFILQDTLDMLAQNTSDPLASFDTACISDSLEAICQQGMPDRSRTLDGTMLGTMEQSMQNPGKRLHTNMFEPSDEQVQAYLMRCDLPWLIYM